jgi:hemoglobin-like flavoprotein
MIITLFVEFYWFSWIIINRIYKQLPNNTQFPLNQAKISQTVEIYFTIVEYANNIRMTAFLGSMCKIAESLHVPFEIKYGQS